MILKTILQKIIKRHIQSDGLLKITVNVGWLFADKILRMGGGLVVGVWIARYLGPEQYGLWNYAIAFTALFGAFATLGLDSLVIRDIVKYPSRRDELLGSTFCLKLLAGGITLLLTICIIHIVKPGDQLSLYLVALSSAGFIFQSVNVIDLYFQSQIQSKNTVLANNTAFVIAAIIKVWLLIIKAPLIAFACVGAAEITLGSVFLIIAYKYNHLSIRNWKFNGTVAKDLLKDSWPLILSDLAILIYMRIDQVMIGSILGNQEVGIYSAAVRIAEVWYFIPMAVVSSLFPAIILSKKNSKELYFQRLQKLFNLMTLLGLFVAVATVFLSSFIVRVLFGVHYVQSGTVLILLNWSGIATCLGVASSIWLMAENMQRYSFYRTGAGCIINILLNLLLIPKFGVNGAALATIVSYFAATYFILFFKDTRILGLMLLKSLNPFQIFKNLQLSFKEE